MVSAPIGCTSVSGPNASAATCSVAPSPLSATEPHQAGRRTGAYVLPGPDAATRS